MTDPDPPIFDHPPAETSPATRDLARRVSRTLDRFQARTGIRLPRPDRQPTDEQLRELIEAAVPPAHGRVGPEQCARLRRALVPFLAWDQERKP